MGILLSEMGEKPDALAGLGFREPDELEQRSAGRIEYLLLHILGLSLHAAGGPADQNYLCARRQARSLWSLWVACSSISSPSAPVILTHRPTAGEHG